MARLRIPTQQQFTAPFQSRAAFVDFLRTPEGIHGHATIGDARWSNKDLEPTPLEHRTWTWYNLPLYWFSNQFSLTGWNTGSALVAVGLTWQQSFISCVLGSLLAAIVVVAMARPGAKYHIGFPVLCRSVMGMYGSYFFVAIRAVVCIIWYGIQTFYGASILSVMFRCIFGSSWTGFTNTLAANADITSKTLLAFFIVWLLEFPFMWIHPRHIHYIFTVKGITMPIAAFALFGWCMANGRGLNGMDSYSRNAAVAGTPLGWSIMNGINVIFGSLSPMLVNQPDLSRYCRKPRDAGPIQGVSVFVSSVVVFFLGLAATTSMQGVYGEAYWNIWDLLGAILDHNWTPGARAGVFFVALAFLLGVFATNFGANSIPFGADMTGLFPKWLTIKRGQILCSILGLTDKVIMIDYAVVRRGNVHVPSCYNGSKTGLYWFKSGVNWIGAAAWLLGTTMGIPGLIGQYQPDIISDAARRMYMMGWILTFVTASVVYVVGVKVMFRKTMKIQVFPTGFDAPLKWEWLANEGRDGFFEGEREGELYAAGTPATTSAEEVHLGEKGQKSDVRQKAEH
ncbi:hypothetical protein ACHAQH_009617 [Verticillium albo-atrum]